MDRIERQDELIEAKVSEYRSRYASGGGPWGKYYLSHERSPSAQPPDLLACDRPVGDPGHGSVGDPRGVV